MAEKIYIRNASGELEPLTEERFETEDLLQQLIGQHPELLAGDQMRPDDPLRWILIKREMPIEGWALDHLLIDQHSRPTLVEVKRGANREIRRNIVGQMLDYAATAAVVWSGDGMRRAFEKDVSKRDADPLDELRKLLQSDDETDAEDLANEFWERAATNLAATRLRLLFVADEIPPELERVATFLNEQTQDNLEVLAVEVKQYPGSFGDAFVSRVIGQIELPRDGSTSGTSSGGTRRITPEEFLNSLAPDVSDAADRLLNAAIGAGGVVEPRPGSVVVGAQCPGYGNRVTNVAQFYAPTDSQDGQFTFRIYFDHAHTGVQALLREWIAQFDDDDFGAPYSYQRWMPGRSVNPEQFVEHADLLSERLRNVIVRLQELRSDASN